MVIDFSKVVTKSMILSKVNEEDIFARYGVPVQTGSFKSPLRIDRRPTCNFYRRNDRRLMLIDHSGHFHGDCFDLVMFTQHIGFGQALHRVATDFHLTDGVVSDYVKREWPEIPIAETADIRVRRRNWNSEDKRYWGRWDFKPDTLNLYHISPIERAWVDGEPIYAYRKKGDEAYVYHFGQYDYKIYFPHRDSHRFRHNNSWLLQGYLQLPPTGGFVVLTKSLKDVAKLHEFGIPAVAPMSESVLPQEGILADLADRFGRIIVFYDNDRAGKRQMVKIRKAYGHVFNMEFLYFPKGYPKDFTDYYEQKGLDNTLSLIGTVRAELDL